MADRDLTKALRNRGRLCINPGNLAAEFPHGGTDLGLIRACSVRFGHTYTLIKAEEWGNEVVEGIDEGEAIALACLLRGADDNALNTVYPNTAVGATSKHRVIEGPGSNRAGALLSARSVVLCFSPDDPNHEMVLLYKALPMLDETAELALSTTDEFETAAVFTGIRDGSGRLYKVGRKVDLSL